MGTSETCGAGPGSIEAILAQEGLKPADWDCLMLTEIDSILVAELMATAADVAGHVVAEDAFPPAETSVGDLVRFSGQYTAD